MSRVYPVSVAAIEEVTGPSSLLLKDGTTLTSIDALVLATGFHHTPPTLFSPSTLAKLNPPKDWVVARGENEIPLWQHLVAPALPSLALMYTGFAGEGAPVVSDIKVSPSAVLSFYSCIADLRDLTGLVCAGDVALSTLGRQNPPPSPF